MYKKNILSRQALKASSCGLASVLVVSLLGCAGGAKSAASNAGILPDVVPDVPTTPPGQQSHATQSVPVTLRYLLPNGIGSSSNASRRFSSARNRRYLLSPPSTIDISLDITPLDGATTTSTSDCTADASGSSATCTIAFDTAPGPTTLAGTISESGNVIARFSQMEIIEPGTANAINFTASPIVSSVAVQLASTSVSAGTPADIAVVINALDANGNTIADTMQYVDADGNPVTFGLTVENAQGGGRGNVSLRGSTRITAPGQQATYVHYDGNWLANSAISLASSSNEVTVQGPVTLTTVPTTIQFTAGTTFGANPYEITPAPDGNLWFTETSANRIANITQSGVVNEFSNGITFGAGPQDITLGPDGNLWFTESAGNRIGRITLAGAVTEYSSGITFGASPDSIVLGSDGNLWFTERLGNRIGSITPEGVVTEYATGISPGAGLAGIALGPDGNLWFTETLGNRIGQITTSGVVTEFSSGITLGSGPLKITSGPDGNLWFTESLGNRIGQITPSGSVAEFSTGITFGANPFSIVSGPDGNLWFTEGLGNRIARITLAGTVTEFTSGITAGSLPHGMAVSSDGNIWFTELSGNRIGKLTL